MGSASREDRSRLTLGAIIGREDSKETPILKGLRRRDDVEGVDGLDVTELELWGLVNVQDSDELSRQRGKLVLL